MSDTATLTYFHGRGRAEQSRWMLAAAGIAFKNRCLNSNEEFLKLKAEGLPFNVMPLLEIDGMKITQSQAINRFIARKADLYGKNQKEALFCDMLAEAVNDSIGGIMSYPFKTRSYWKEGKDQEGEKVGAELLDSFISKHFPRIENRIKSNKEENKESPYSVGKSLTYADVLIAALAHGYEEGKPNCLEKYPGIKEIHSLVIKLPGVKKYLTSSNYFPYPKGKVAIEYTTNVDTVLDRL